MSPIELALDDLDERDLVLEPRLRPVRGSDAGDPDARRPLMQRLAVGGPRTIPLTPETLYRGELEPEARRVFAHQGAAFDFYLVHLTCTFRPVNDEPFMTAAVTIELRGPASAEQEPIAWSMQPERLTTTRWLSTSIKLTPALKIIGVGLEGEAGRSEQWESHDVFVQALYEGLPTPTWELTTTRTAPIDGMQRFALIVRAPKATTTQALVTIRATVRRRRWGVIPYHAAFPAGAPALEFQLP